MAAARALVFEMGSTTPWLTAEFQDLRYVITDHVVRGAPVWAAADGVWLMYRAGNGTMTISDEANYTAGRGAGVMYNTVESPDVMAPTQLPSNQWKSNKHTTRGPQYTSAPKHTSNTGHQPVWSAVPEMRVTAVHGLDDAEPAMAAALRHLAALSEAA